MASIGHHCERCTVEWTCGHTPDVVVDTRVIGHRPEHPSGGDPLSLPIILDTLIDEDEIETVIRPS